MSEPVLVKNSPWAVKVVGLEYLGLCAPGCTEPLIRVQLSSKQFGTHELDVSLSEQAQGDLALALELFETQREQIDTTPKQ